MWIVNDLYVQKSERLLKRQYLIVPQNRQVFSISHIILRFVYKESACQYSGMLQSMDELIIQGTSSLGPQNR